MNWGGVRYRCTSPSSVPNRTRRGLRRRFGAAEGEVRLAPAAPAFRAQVKELHKGLRFSEPWILARYASEVLTLSAEQLVREVLELWATLRETPHLSAGAIPFEWRPDEDIPIGDGPAEWHASVLRRDGGEGRRGAGRAGGGGAARTGVGRRKVCTMENRGKNT
eukprot:532060-Amphidinium_carterae.1